MHLVFKILHVLLPNRGAVVKFVLDLAGNNRSGSIGELMPSYDRINLAQPF